MSGTAGGGDGAGCCGGGGGGIGSGGGTGGSGILPIGCATQGGWCLTPPLPPPFFPLWPLLGGLPVEAKKKN